MLSLSGIIEPEMYANNYPIDWEKEKIDANLSKRWDGIVSSWKRGQIDEKRPTEKPNKVRPNIKFQNDKSIVIKLPTIPIIHVIITAFLLPILINTPPLIAPIVIPRTIELPI